MLRTIGVIRVRYVAVAHCGIALTDTRLKDSDARRREQPPDDIQPAPNPSRRARRVEPVLMDTNELAGMLNMSASWVYREAAKLGLKGYKLGEGRNAKVLYKKTEVLRWLEQQKIH